MRKIKSKIKIYGGLSERSNIIGTSIRGNKEKGNIQKETGENISKVLKEINSWTPK